MKAELVLLKVVLFVSAITVISADQAEAQFWKKLEKNITGFLEDPAGTVKAEAKRAEKQLLDSRDKLVKEGEKVSERLAKLEQDIHNLSPSGVSEELWGEAGRIAYVSAAATMRTRSPHGKPLDFWTKAILHGRFGGLVERVRIHWDVSPLDKWVASNIGIDLSGTDTVAQTYGYDIYIDFKEGERPREEVISLLAHEMMHTAQFVKYDSSFSNFGYHYFKEFKKANQKYENNKLEKEAFEVEREFDDYIPVALDANGGSTHDFYFNKDIKQNDNLLYEVAKHGDKVTIVPIVKKKKAFDANGGHSIYMGNNQLPNDNILWKLEPHGNYVSIISAIKRDGTTTVAWDANGGREAPYLNEYKLPNDNLLWDIYSNGESAVIIPKVGHNPE
ncbi:hypothetical protein [Stratiformator vulcanicus]|uniref:DUF4157 domain-containing protein n=1 Tax=Stratiformator vulcanicus TaxID=2527980 RepID=A0A517R2L5_9PLAN|nr:hypothetical protein [Stratiformator vulcanicus]QDT38101.1 hypothetical protein Pan189_24910 [Stratiformator vulcanicus]